MLDHRLVNCCLLYEIFCLRKSCSVLTLGLWVSCHSDRNKGTLEQITHDDLDFCATVYFSHFPMVFYNVYIHGGFKNSLVLLYKQLFEKFNRRHHINLQENLAVLDI